MSNVFILFLPVMSVAEVQLVPFISWSVVAAALFAVVAIAYRIYLKKKKDDLSV
jgi:tryptophan-rich sensory protein